MDLVVLAVFVLVYLGMILGRIPGLAMDRTGIALLGAIVLVGSGRVSPTEAWRAMDVPTMALLLGLMVVSAQLRLGGFYSEVTRRVAATGTGPGGLLAAVIAVAGGLSALLANDIVCLAMAPLLVVGCLRRGFSPQPHLLGLACGANIGSAATLIGNPQNMLIGQRLELSFAGYLVHGVPPAVIGCALAWVLIALVYRGRWRCPPRDLTVDSPAFNSWQTGKGIALVVALVAVFLAAPVPRDVAALAAAGLLLTSRRMHSRDMLGHVDWQLLVLFAGLFVVHHGLESSGLAGDALAAAAASGLDLAAPGWLFAAGVVLSNLVSNVPAVMLLLPAATGPTAGAVLALSSTLAGNLLLVGSIANLIVVDQAARLGVVIRWREHARVGIPVTLASLAVAAGWLVLVARLG
ncbi:MAG TPA: anion transporter [Methylomirabilota bacterium]|nr:anion transporter [Methylomirabilota bacterium]